MLKGKWRYCLGKRYSFGRCKKWNCINKFYVNLTSTLSLCHKWPWMAKKLNLFLFLRFVLEMRTRYYYGWKGYVFVKKVNYVIIFYFHYCYLFGSFINCISFYLIICNILIPFVLIPWAGILGSSVSHWVDQSSLWWLLLDTS